MTNKCNVANNFGIAEGAPQNFSRYGSKAKPVPLKKLCCPFIYNPIMQWSFRQCLPFSFR